MALSSKISLKPRGKKSLSLSSLGKIALRADRTSCYVYTSLRAGSSLSGTRASGQEQSGEEAPRKSLSRLAASPLDFTLAAKPGTLVL